MAGGKGWEGLLRSDLQAKEAETGWNLRLNCSSHTNEKEAWCRQMGRRDDGSHRRGLPAQGSPRKSLELTLASPFPMSRTMNKYGCLPWFPAHFQGPWKQASIGCDLMQFKFAQLSAKLRLLLVKALAYPL